MTLLAKNSKAFYEYDIKDTFEAGLVLSGSEVKSAKSGNVSLQGSYVVIAQGQATLLNCHIGPYKYAPNDSYEPTRTRLLLLHKKEMNELVGKEKGLTIVPLEMYSTGKGLVKLKIGLARGRKKTDKREYLKKREDMREAREHKNM